MAEPAEDSQLEEPTEQEVVDEQDDTLNAMVEGGPTEVANEPQGEGEVVEGQANEEPAPEAENAKDNGEANAGDPVPAAEGEENLADVDQTEVVEGEAALNAEDAPDVEGVEAGAEATAESEAGEANDVKEGEAGGEEATENAAENGGESTENGAEENTENTADVTENAADVTENAVDVTENAADVTGNAADVTENADETLEKAGEEVVAPVKKEVKRKARPQKIADANLILEEDDEELQNQKQSPGPPALEPIGQNLEESDKLTLNIHGDFNRDNLGATTPDRAGDATLDDEYQEIEPDKPTREEIIERYKAIIEERDKLQNTNNQLHHKLADYYRKRKSEEAQNQPLFDKSSQEQEQRYIKYLSTIEELRKQLERERWEAEKEMEDLKEKCELKQGWVNEDRIRFNKIKRETAQKSVSTHSGKAPPSKEIEAYMQRENQKELEVINVRLENIKLKNQLKKKEQELKAKEELGEGLHMIDFEQLKIENQTYNEKIEERNEELMKLKKKINNTVQILTHVKEKLQFVYVENEKEKLNLDVYDQQVKKNRDILNKIKQSRDSLRLDNSRLKQNSGLLGNSVLLRDFEECVDQNDNLEAQIEYLKRRHAELILNSKGIKQKISQTKAP